MLDSFAQIGDATPAVQLALTPAFLLAGIGAILNVMTQRLGRIVDRGRHLTDVFSGGSLPLPDDFETELADLERRRHLASTAITNCVLSALLVCTVVTVLFLEALLQTNLNWLIGSLFMGATVTLVIGLGFFLREVQLATRAIRFLKRTGEK